ncbi:MAG: hypothetical protein QOE93_1549, partial [Actinomycetota bacterium]|nr:hypothetical protein [Actinomycetota bacterium]
MGRQKIIAIVLVAAFALAFVGGGLLILRTQRTGARATATVTACHHGYRTVTCTGRWIAGGSLLEGGHVVFGTIDGAAPADVGDTLEVRLHGGRA